MNELKIYTDPDGRAFCCWRWPSVFLNGEPLDWATIWNIEAVNEQGGKADCVSINFKDGTHIHLRDASCSRITVDGYIIFTATADDFLDRSACNGAD